MKTIEELVSDFRREKSLTVVDFAKQARVSSKSIMEAGKGRYDKLGSRKFKDARAKRGVEGTIARLVTACGADPKPYLDALKLDYRPGEIEGLDADRLAVEEAPGLLIEQTDLDFLSVVIKGLNKPLPLTLAVQLLKVQRSTVAVEPKQE